MKRIVSASRRTDLVAFFPEWLASAVKNERALVYGPSGRAYTADLRPQSVHTFVLWSKNFESLIKNRHGLRDCLAKHGQLYFHFTVTGLGGSFIEPGVPPPEKALAQLEALVGIAGHPERVSLRFDPVVFWEEKGRRLSNLTFFENLAPRAASMGIKTVRFSFAQWYEKARRRAARCGFRYIDPPAGDKLETARRLVGIAREQGISLFSCSQDFLAGVPGIRPSSCIDGRLLEALHPSAEPASQAKDKSQRRECRCTESVDIGSYTQPCPHSCLYCYANPRL